MLKKILALMLAVVMLGTFAVGCKKKPVENGSSDLTSGVTSDVISDPDEDVSSSIADDIGSEGCGMKLFDSLPPGIGSSWAIPSFKMCSTSFIVLGFFIRYLIPSILVVKLYIPIWIKWAKKLDVHKLLPSGR